LAPGNVKILALKIYADTQRGYREGTPRLLDAFGELGISASFFFGMGSEGSGSPLSRLFGADRPIVASAPGILRDASKRGQDCGLYGWNPREWSARLDRMRDTTLEADVRRAMEYFSRRVGERPRGFAAPGCRVNYMSLRIEDDMRFAYCSDTFGFYPFMPRLAWKVFSTPQIPATLPPVELVIKESQGEALASFSSLWDSLPDGLSVLPMNASIGANGAAMENIFVFLRAALDAGAKFMNLADVAAKLNRDSLSSCEIAFASAFGMANDVAVQSLD
jgi:hypothetical protein